MSGLSRTPGKRVQVHSLPRVRIPLSPPEHMPRKGHFFGRRLAKSLRTSRRGFEGFGLQAKPRPAECRRIPLSPPIYQMPRQGDCRFGAKRSLCVPRAALNLVIQLFPVIALNLTCTAVNDSGKPTFATRQCVNRAVLTTNYSTYALLITRFCDLSGGVE